MITNEEQLEQSLEQFERMVRTLSSLREEVLPRSQQYFALMAEGPLEEIRRLEQQISAYLIEVLRPLDEEASRDEQAEKTALEARRG